MGHFRLARGIPLRSRVRRSGAALVLCLALLAPAAAQGPGATADAELRRAITLVVDGDFSAGITALDASLRRLEGARGRNGDRALAHFYAGVALVAQGRTAAARSRFARALAENPALAVSAREFPPKVMELLAAARAPQARPSPPAPAGLRLVRSASGSRGAHRGPDFALEDVRTVFDVPADRQAVVSFEWQAPAGTYRLEGTWRDPQGAAHLQPAVDATSAGERLVAYWLLALPRSITPGRWTLEIVHEGRPIGHHAIQVSAAPAMPELSDSDLYLRVGPALATVDRRDADGRSFGRGLGFFVGPDLLVTAFQVVEGARSLQVRTSDGRALLATRLAAWDRGQDWALVDVPGAAQPVLRLAPGPLPPACRVIDVDGDHRPALGRKVVASLLPAGDRLRLGVAGSVSDAGFRLVLGPEAAGGPLFDLQGAVVGILGGSRAPGEISAEGRLPLAASLATPVSLLPSLPPVWPGATLAELISRGESLEPTRRTDVIRVVLGKRLPAGGTTPPEEETTDFTRADRTLVAWALWAPHPRRTARLEARICDPRGAVLAKGEALNIRFEPGESPATAWPLDVSALPPGFHRVEVLLDSAVVWRGYFHLQE